MRSTQRQLTFDTAALWQATSDERRAMSANAACDERCMFRCSSGLAESEIVWMQLVGRREMTDRQFS